MYVCFTQISSHGNKSLCVYTHAPYTPVSKNTYIHVTHMYIHVVYAYMYACYTQIWGSYDEYAP